MSKINIAQHTSWQKALIYDYVLLDWSLYRDHVQANMVFGETCPSSFEQKDFVTFIDSNDNNCTIHILKMCNGLMHCEDCADEVFEDCMQHQCSIGNQENIS